MPIRFLAVFALAIGWCAWTGDARAQGSAETDRAALVAVYRATGGVDWTNNANWLSDRPLEDWYGVETDEQGRVTGLRLGGWDEATREYVGNGLVGSLPPELGALSHLLWLEVGGNSGLTGPIPSALGNLSELESLFLQANWFTGSIPAALGRLGNLEWVGLDHNALAGSIPAELGNLTHLRGLTICCNVLSGRIPPELGGLTSLTDFELSETMLSGPLPASLTRLSALEWLNLDGSGLCVPDTPGMRAWLAGISDFSGVVCDESLTFVRVMTQPNLGRLDRVTAVVDLDGDGFDDILAGGRDEYHLDGTPEDRFETTPLHMFVGAGDGRFKHAPELVEGTVEVRVPVVVAGDFNSDSRTDLAIFDHGVYVAEQSLGYGIPPQLLLSGQDGVRRPSSALADAVRGEHELRPHPGYSGPADLHVKRATSGDIDGDGDLDLWVESTGGANVSSHFMVNNGDGTFTIEPARTADEVLRNNPPSYRRHVGNALVDVDNDGDLDLALGHIQNDPEPSNRSSTVLLNDGSGHYPTRIDLPLAALNGGQTAVQALTHFDVDADGFQDLLLVHERDGARNTIWGPPNTISHTGRYIQMLVNRGGASFRDETPARMGDQSATAMERNPDGEPLYNSAAPTMHDVDRDGCVDLVMSQGVAPVRTESPLVYGSDGRGRFRAMPPVPFTGSDRHFGHSAVPIDVNGDSAIDFVMPLRDDGPDRRHGTADDFTTLLTLLNTTPAGPVRCGAPANQSPTPVGALPDRTLAPAGTLIVDVSQAFVDPDGDALTYTVSSSAPRAVTARAAGVLVTLTAVGEGAATIRVTATDPGGLSAAQSFTVTVSTTVSRSFTDDPIRPGVTPVKAVHFTELRTRIDALRRAGGLQAFPWTDPLLRTGVTRVRLAHLLELREALAAAYAAAGRSAPGWTDGAPSAGTTPIRAAHLMELRDAILALE